MEAPNLQRRCNHVHPGPLTDEARNRAADRGGSDDLLAVGWSSSQVSYLCEGFDTPSDEVFFVKEFRDDSLTTKSTREEYARAAILNHLNQSRQSGRNEDVIWTFPPEKDFANEILSGIALYNISGHRGALEAVRHKITNALNDGNLPIEQNENVMAILNWNKYLKNTTFGVERAL
ncbi:hypothetical protein SCARD494_11582 [Seiridium cardinale]